MSVIKGLTHCTFRPLKKCTVKPLGELVINTTLEFKEGEKRTISTRVGERDVVIINAAEKM